MPQRPSGPEELARWTAVDHYCQSILGADDPELQATLESSRAEGLPSIQVSPMQGRFLHLLARAINARRILEIGTLGAYSTIWLARALPPGGVLVTLEVNPVHARVARANLSRAALPGRVELVEGPALDSLSRLAREGADPFDLVFIDADKPSYPEYLEWSLRLARPGTVIVADNVVRRGDVVEEESTDLNVLGIRRMNEKLAGNPLVVASVMQTVGSKGYDGMMIAYVLSRP
jgi:predicted O-methyltransferase YrrM